jgi:hypothetical protein
MAEAPSLHGLKLTCTVPWIADMQRSGLVALGRCRGIGASRRFRNKAGFDLCSD